MKNNTKLIMDGIYIRIINAIKKDQLWKWELLNEWRFFLAVMR